LRDAARDAAGTLARYRNFLSLGGTQPLPALYAAAGARMIFDAEGMGALVGLVEERISAQRATSA